MNETKEREIGERRLLKITERKGITVVGLTDITPPFEGWNQ